MVAVFLLALALDGERLETVSDEIRHRAEREGRPILLYSYDSG
jgi:hypothetical protein